MKPQLWQYLQRREVPTTSVVRFDMNTLVYWGVGGWGGIGLCRAFLSLFLKELE